MTGRPPFFERVRQLAARRWDQLEADEDLAGPWHQLFKQVQSPRHIVSELLQNADDAGATTASVRVEDKVFIFEHDGEDFKEEHFTSLCRFGYSNKRALHTIGFRGIGFKSTFSLGPEVELQTPSLSVVFHQKRFTEPVWSGKGIRKDGRTCVRVTISDQHREGEVEKNFKDWLKSPVSLLFFKHIRRLQIGDQALHWESMGPGPAPGSEWMALNGDAGKPFLVIRSGAEEFPEEALAEIRQERMVARTEETKFPPSKVEIVLGTEGRLFVVLPTGVKTALPFACNAPFIQDPARERIKDPETSPTNRWLLERAGKLASAAMHAWLEQSELPIEERARAYGLIPDVNREDNTIDGVCGRTVEIAFGVGLGETRAMLLTDDGTLTTEGKCVLIPGQVQDVWPGDQAVALLDTQGRPALSLHVSASDRKKLLNWNLIEEIDKSSILNVLRRKHLPKPKKWRQLFKLWSYIASELTYYISSPNELRIVPVQGKEVLYAASEVARLGEKKLLQSEEDWEFLAAYLLVLNPNWNRYLADQRLTAEKEKDEKALSSVNAMYSILEKIGLDKVSDVGAVMNRVATGFFAAKPIELDGAVRLAQIAAALGAPVGETFPYVTRGGDVRSGRSVVLFDASGDLESLIPEDHRDSRLLHGDYAANFSSCTREEWMAWVDSGRSGLREFVPIIERRYQYYTRDKIKAEVRKRGYEPELEFPFVTHDCALIDWDFDESVWRHWNATSASDDKLWQRVVQKIVAQRESFWRGAMGASAIQISTSHSTRTITDSPMPPGWALRLRDLPCLPDTRGFLHKPGDLLRRCAETEAYLDVEPFVHTSLDREAWEPLLDLLGVRTVPSGPGQVVERIRALSKAANAPVGEIEKWYRRLDQMIDTCSTEDAAAVRQAFRSEKLVLTESGAWATSAGVFLLAGGDEVPGAAVVRAAVRDLSLWRKLGVSDLATADLAIEWLLSLPSGKALAQDEARRVRAFLARHPLRVWEECRHWANLAGEWAPVGELRYSLTMQALVPTRHLHETVKQKTADFQDLSAEINSAAPFSGLSPLAAHIEERINKGLPLFGQAEEKPWIRALGEGLRRVELNDELETARVRALADDLAVLKWQVAPKLETIPYIDGTPAGTSRRADVVWQKRILYVETLSTAKLAKKVPEELGRAFDRSDIKAALDYSYERSPEEVRAYLEENFKLVAADAAPAAPTPDPSTSTAEPKEARPEGPDTQESKAPELPPEQKEEPHDPEVDSGIPPESVDEPDIRRQPRIEPKPPKPSIIERYALAHGFEKDGDGRYFHSNGSWIAKTVDAPFPWERRSRAAELIRYFWPKDHCLDQEPLSLEADIWAMIDNSPSQYALLLAGPDGSPIEMPGTYLRDLVTKGKLKLYPAAYRLKIESTEHA